MGLMQIPRRVDCGLRAVIYLAVQGPRKCCSITEIAKQQGVPKKVLEKIIRDLIRCGLIKSKRGACGGYTLARSPERISFYDVIEAIEGPIAVNAWGCKQEMVRIQRSIRPASRMQDWQEAYSRLRHSLPSKYQLLHAKFDALNNRALYSREPLQRFWNDTLEQLKGMRLWNIHPGKLTASLIKDLFLTTSFVFTFRAGSRAE
jgi:Rrf2 family protein